MSAWIVNKPHIDALVQALIEYRLIGPSHATEIGRDLWAENHKSVNYRYGEAEKAPEYKFEGVEAHVDPAVIARNIRCYWYQTCEHPDSPAYADNTLLAQLAAKLGEPDKGRDDIPWGIDDIRQAIQAT